MHGFKVKLAYAGRFFGSYAVIYLSFSFVPPLESYGQKRQEIQSRASGAADYPGEEGILDGVIVVK